MIDAGQIPLALYVHIPWCVKKCPYCDFNSHAKGDDYAEPAYVEALAKDLLQDLARFPELVSRPVQSVFFGGGTPSLFSGDAIRRILDAARAQLRFATDCEITLETNPGTAEYDRFEAYLDAGVNRLSFGVQSFAPEKLRRLGRIHDDQQARLAVRAAQTAGFQNINLDLMYALPEQTLDEALHDIEQGLQLAPTHVSHYQLTLEPNTLFAAKPPPLPDDELAYDMQLACQDMLARHGYGQYEVSAYAKSERQSRHNLNYWSFGDYLGIGAGAHGKLTRPSGEIVRTARKKLPRSFMLGVLSDQALAEQNAIPESRLAFEFMLNALRLNQGFAFAQFEQRTGLDRATLALPIATATSNGLLEVDADGAWPSELGRRFLNDLIALFLDEDE